jgi:hypothetical protein
VSDSPTGHDRAPDRYTTQDRETIDRMRDLAHAMFADPAVADAVFAYHCIATALKYSDRYGLKDLPEIDAKKLHWYLAMASHVRDGTPDPRSERADFKAWEKHPVRLGDFQEDARRLGLSDLVQRLLS